MGLTIQGSTVTMQSKVTIYGNEAETVQMYGKEVWKKYTDGWETVFSDEAYFKESGSMTVNGLKPGRTDTRPAGQRYTLHNPSNTLRTGTQE